MQIAMYWALKMIVQMEFALKGKFQTVALDFRIISQLFPFSRKCKCVKKTKKTKKTKKSKKTKKTKKANKHAPIKCIEDATCDVLGTEDDCPDGICYEG